MDRCPSPHFILALRKEPYKALPCSSLLSATQLHRSHQIERQAHNTPFVHITSVHSPSSSLRCFAHEQPGIALLCYIADQKLPEHLFVSALGAQKDLKSLATKIAKQPSIKSMIVACTKSARVWLYSRWPDGPAFHWKQRATLEHELGEFCASQNLRALALQCQEAIYPSFSAMMYQLWSGHLPIYMSLADNFTRLPLGQLLYVDYEQNRLQSLSLESKKWFVEEFLELFAKKITPDDRSPLLEIKPFAITSLEQARARLACEPQSVGAHLLPAKEQLARLFTLPQILYQELILSQKKPRSAALPSPLWRRLLFFLASHARSLPLKKSLNRLLRAQERHRFHHLLKRQYAQTEGLSPLLRSHLHSYFDPAWPLAKQAAIAIAKARHNETPSSYLPFMIASACYDLLPHLSLYFKEEELHHPEYPRNLARFCLQQTLSQSPPKESAASSSPSLSTNPLSIPNQDLLVQSRREIEEELYKGMLQSEGFLPTKLQLSTLAKPLLCELYLLELWLGAYVETPLDRLHEASSSPSVASQR